MLTDDVLDGLWALPHNKPVRYDKNPTNSQLTMSNPGKLSDMHSAVYIGCRNYVKRALPTPATLLVHMRRAHAHRWPLTA